MPWFDSRVKKMKNMTLVVFFLILQGSKLTKNWMLDMQEKEIQRYEKNPFIENMVIPIRDQQVKLSRLGKDRNVLVNPGTGEDLGTHLTTYKKVDGEQFVKLFTQNIALTFDLNSAGIKAFTILMWSVQHGAISKDQVDLDHLTLEDFLSAHPERSLSQATMKRGLRDLEKAQILARTLRKGRYFINPNFVFNGDRIAFTTLLERKTAAEEERDRVRENQESLALDGPIEGNCQ
jgi:hypothetical protein